MSGPYDITDIIISHILHALHLLFFITSIILASLVCRTGGMTPFMMAAGSEAFTFIILLLGTEFNLIKRSNHSASLNQFYFLFAMIQTVAVATYYIAMSYNSLSTLIILTCIFPILINTSWICNTGNSNFYVPKSIWMTRLARIVLLICVILILINNPYATPVGTTMAIISTILFISNHYFMMKIKYRVWGSDFQMYGSLMSLPFFIFICMIGGSSMMQNPGIALVSCLFRAIATLMETLLVQKFKPNKSFVSIRFFIIIVVTLFLPHLDQYKNLPPSVMVGIALLFFHAIYTFFARYIHTKDIFLYSVDIWCLSKASGLLYKMTNSVDMVYDFINPVGSETLKHMVVEPNQVIIDRIISEANTESKFEIGEEEEIKVENPIIQTGKIE